jgi:hypothetical protein
MTLRCREVTMPQSVFPAPDHDHGRCASAAIAHAEVLCAARAQRLTPMRRHVLEALLDSHRPLGAYEIIERLARQGRPAPMPSAVALGALAYQAVWVVCVTYMAWFALIVRYSASRLSSFTFLTPLFGVVAGHMVLNEPLSPPFALAVALVAIGLVLVNRPR